ncbi:unnamed protein product [Auanema sp. JU1783]|nr:unnamed protein product [Auanema sp. JU1783]
MRSVGPADDKHEKKPMLKTGSRSDLSKNGAIEIPEPLVDNAVQPNTEKVWLKRQLVKLYALQSVIGVISIAVLIAIIILIYSVYHTTNSSLFQSQNDTLSDSYKEQLNSKTDNEKTSDSYPWYDKTCASVGVCKRKGYTQPPLLIISFDGFSYKYMKKKIMKSLTYFSNCGVKAERVIPCFPSRTFPNHYAIATGLYPESHGIVDNNIYDPTIAPIPQSTKNTKHDELWMGTPIWKAYHDQTNKKTACLFWPGCAYNISGYKPEHSPTYDKSVALDDRFELVHKWLAEEDHPELVLAYVEQPDSAGHNQKSEKEVDDALEELDHVLNKFLTNLHNDNLLDCINIAIVSDHGKYQHKLTVSFIILGMQLLENLVYIPDFVETESVVATSGVIGRLFSTNLTSDELSEPFTCQKVEGVRVFTRETMPVRKHHAKIPRVGDVILQGEPGTTFDIKKRGMLAADHGYDIIHDNMHTIFFARGPSFKKNFTISPFQHVEYMNLWTELLKLEHVPNNGSNGFMDVLMVDPPIRQALPTLSLQECEKTGESLVSFCEKCDSRTKKSITESLSNCDQIKSDYLSFESSAGSSCVRNYCRNAVLGASSKTPAVLEEIHRSDLLNAPSCGIAVSKYESSPVCASSTNTYLSSNIKSRFGKINEANFNATSGFVETVLNPLNTLTLNYVRKFGLIWTMSGLAFDKNMDGLADVEQDQPTHFYRTLFYCTSLNKGVCKDVDIISFIFPLMNIDVNCLTTEQLLIEYTARLRDIEIISGYKWKPNNLSHHRYHSLRIHINLAII